MEALEFLKASQRICEANHYVDCPLKNKCLYVNHGEDKLEEIVSAVEQWSKEHPIITNAKKFEEIFGVKPENAEVPYRSRSFPNWWDEPYKEPKHES